jgi:hypothetical protein
VRSEQTGRRLLKSYWQICADDFCDEDADKRLDYLDLVPQEQRRSTGRAGG